MSNIEVIIDTEIATEPENPYSNVWKHSINNKGERVITNDTLGIEITECVLTDEEKILRHKRFIELVPDYLG